MCVGGEDEERVCMKRGGVDCKKCNKLVKFANFEVFDGPEISIHESKENKLSGGKKKNVSLLYSPPPLHSPALRHFPLKS